VHDYHLIPLGRELRRLGVTNRIGFFPAHPWPARQLVMTLPKHRELVSALFDYDLVGFHTREWLDAFHGYVVKEAGGTVEPDGRVSAFGRPPGRGLSHRHRRAGVCGAGRVRGGAGALRADVESLNGPAA
jgi:trehalose-6-phosphate synthase